MSGSFLPFGTGFFVGVKQDDWDFLYLVTARHVLDKAMRSNCTLEMRLNRRNGGFEYVKLQPSDQWLRGRDDSVDGAILPLVVDFAIRLTTLSRRPAAPSLNDSRHPSQRPRIGGKII